MARNGEMIKLESGDGAHIGCYHAAAQGNCKGGLIVIQEIFGVTDHIKEVCDGFAARGYEVLAPQLFDRMEKDFQATYAAEDVERSKELAGKNPWDHVQMDVQMCIDRLKADGPVFMTGYCYGGSVCWVAACRCKDLTAASGYYGRLIVQFVDETPQCPIILHFGEHDGAIPMTDVHKIIEVHPDIPVYIYDAGHGFNSDRRDDYDKDCADLALKRTLELFESAAGV